MREEEHFRRRSRVEGDKLFQERSDTPRAMRPTRATSWGLHHEGGVRVPVIAAWAKASAVQKRLPIVAGAIQSRQAAVQDLFPTSVPRSWCSRTSYLFQG